MIRISNNCSFLNGFISEYHCYSKIISLVPVRRQETPAVSRDEGSGSGKWGGGGCPLSASLLCRTSSWAPHRLANHGSLFATHLHLGGGRGSSCRPLCLSVLYTKITLAGRCKSHIPGIFASVLCIVCRRSFCLICVFYD